MACNLNIYQQPELLDTLKGLVDNMKAQVRMVEGLEHARKRLESTTHLDSNTLAKCKVFVRYVNESTPDSNFYMEVSKLNINETAFCAISFEERRLKLILDYFKALNVHQYMKSRKISCEKRREIFTRLNSLCRGKSPFADIYNLLTETAGQQVHETNTEFVDPEPITSAEAPESFDFSAAP